jgi:hypothetical protein
MSRELVHEVFAYLMMGLMVGIIGSQLWHAWRRWIGAEAFRPRVRTPMVFIGSTLAAFLLFRALNDQFREFPIGIKISVFALGTLMWGATLLNHAIVPLLLTRKN